MRRKGRPGASRDKLVRLGDVAGDYAQLPDGEEVRVSWHSKRCTLVRRTVPSELRFTQPEPVDSSTLVVERKRAIEHVDSRSDKGEADPVDPLLQRGAAMKIGDWETHPAADLMPMMDGDAYRKFRDSIAASGLKEPIQLHEGKVLDGRNRLRACLEIDVSPRFEQWSGGDPWEHVWALNAERRHLEPGQRAALRVQFDQAIRVHQELVAEQANRARAAAARRRKQSAEDDTEEEDGGESIATLRSTTSEVLAERAGVGKRTAEKALVVAQRAPELHEAVVRGEITLNKAYQQSRTAQHPEWRAHEAYYTPSWVVDLIADSGYLPEHVDLAVEPCVGGGVFVVGLGHKVGEWFTCDIRDVEPAHSGVHRTMSWLDALSSFDHGMLRKMTKVDLVITNPAFSLAQQVVEMAWAVCPNAQVWIFQRRSWHDQARAAWFCNHQPDEINIGERLRFLRPDGSPVAEGTDNTIHTLYGFSPSRSRRRTGPHGGITRTLVRERK